MNLPFRTPWCAIFGPPSRLAGMVVEQMERFVVGRQNDGRQQVAPDLTGLHQSAEQTVETGDGGLGWRGVTVAEGQGGEVGRLGGPQWAGQGTGSQGTRNQKAGGLVEIGGDVRQMNGVRSDDRPLGGQTPDDTGSVETRDGSGRVEGCQGRNPERPTTI